ncbi:MAG: glycosyltransferase family 2 protein [Sphingobacteriales bacterium]|nr:glycosyltransferase family 2 protein [Sphingobacteriales bacterium]
MTPLSVVIITYNEEKNIGRCISSVKNIADEIIVLDSFSADNTVSIAKEMGATIYQQPFAGYIEQKNKALGFARHQYVLSLDADEAIDAELEKSILVLKKNISFKGYTVNRCTYYCGKFIRHGSWYPDKKLRLFDNHIARYGGVNPHDFVVFDSPPQPVAHLKGEILHYSYNSLDEHIIQNNRFSTIAAEAYFKKGKRSGWFKIIINPAWAFVNDFFFRRGFLNGFYGFIIAKNIAHMTFMKYYKLYALQKNIPVRSKN